MTGTSWVVERAHERLIAIGDVHGDLDALLRILTGLEVIDLEGRWIDPRSHVVLLGDLNDRGPESVNVIGAVVELQGMAESAGGRLDVVLGNHEVLATQGDHRHFCAEEARSVGNLASVFRGDGPVARWIRERPAILRVGDVVFVHAGLGPWALKLDPIAVNATIRAWVEHFQGSRGAPGEDSRWLTTEEGQGPLWTSLYRIGAAEEDETIALTRMLPALLERLNAERLVVGHKPTRAIDHAIALSHPVFGRAVSLVDTGICRYYGGRLSALEVREPDLRAFYFDRGQGDLELTRTVRRRLADLRAGLGDGSRAQEP